MSTKLRVLGLGALVAAGLAIPLIPLAQSPLSATPRYAPMGVSASGNFSTAWFYEQSTGKAMACSTGASGTITCAAAQLP
jgi:hypothetical protein